MDLIKQYIIQSLTAASNNLRLTTHQLEAVGLLRETFLNSKDIESDIKKMKTITELSTLGIRLNEVYNYLTTNKIDFLKISEQFKEHSRFLISDLSHLLEIVNPLLIKKAIKRLRGEPIEDEKEINYDLTEDKTDSNQLIKKNSTDTKELVDEKDGELKNYEEIILKPIKPVDNMLKSLAKNETNHQDLTRFANIMKVNGELSAKNEFEIIAEMHNIISTALNMIKSRELMPGKSVVDSIRACLIVIVAVVRGKDVDITRYLNRAEDFGKEIDVLNI
ncbi:hypothetical protein LJE86_04680 [bacterium BMS3Abin03]|nr:hypothetical protein [bacterium BMS3Abin03]